MDDNARKFLLERLDPAFLREHNPLVYTLIVDWLVTDEGKEKKLVRKVYEDGRVELLLVSKFLVLDEGRKVEKRKLTEEEYKNIFPSDGVHLEKKRYEFNFPQAGVSFLLKYDEFPNGLCMLEVDAPTPAERAAFDPAVFPVKLTEVTGELKYYGYRMGIVVKHET